MSINTESASKFPSSLTPLDVTVDEAKFVTKRPRHVKVALYWVRLSVAEGIPIPPGCNLIITQEGGAHRFTLIDYQSLLRERELWNRGIVPPETPSEAKAKGEARRKAASMGKRNKVEGLAV